MDSGLISPHCSLYISHGADEKNLFYNDYLQTIPRVLYNKICHEETQLEVVGEGNSWLKASSVKEYCRETNPQCTGAWRIAMDY